jgi:hypothetical protein
MKFTLSIVLLFSAVMLLSDRLVAQTSTPLYYFDLNTTQDSYYYLPEFVSSDNDTINAYAERFSCPLNSTLDSVSIELTIDSLGTSTSNTFMDVVALPDTVIGGNLFASNSTIYSDNFISSTDPDFIKGDTILYTRSMGGTIPDTDFFLTILAPDPADTRAVLWADSVTSVDSLPIDENRDRSRLIFTSPYEGFSQYYLAGNHYDTSALYWYPNFVMVAYITTPTGGVAEIYPADQDPLTFYVEQTVTGATDLHFTTQNAGSAELDLYDASGMLVSTLFDGGYAPGQYDVPLVTDGLTSGMYFARLSSGNSSEVRRVIVAH